MPWPDIWWHHLIDFVGGLVPICNLFLLLWVAWEIGHRKNGTRAFKR